LAAAGLNLAHAQPAPGSAATTASGAAQKQTPPDEARLGVIHQTSELLGKKVRDLNDKTLGKVEDLALDLPAGQILAVLVTTGSDAPVTPLPARCICGVDQEKLVAKPDKKTFAAAPKLPKGMRAGAVTEDSLENSAKYFSQPIRAQGKSETSVISSAATLLHSSLTDQSGAAVGQVKDLMVDLPLGRIVYLIVQPSGTNMPKGTLFVLPPHALKLDAAAGKLALKADAARFLAGPHFQNAFWTDLNEPVLAQAVWKYYPAQ
jgi:sporulation protein YlmC with PRC-barrel domain